MKVIDLCAGTGLLARAFQLEGFDVVAGFERDAAKAACWERNIGAPCHVADLTKVTVRDVLQVVRKVRGRCVLVIGGIPCQDFSKMNAHRRFDTALRDHVLELVEGLGAEACIENVREGWRGVDGARPVRDCDVGGLTIRERWFYGAPEVPRTHHERSQNTLDGAELRVHRGWGEVIHDYHWMGDMQHQQKWVERNSIPVRHCSRPAWAITSKTDMLVWKGSSRKSLRWLKPEDLAALNGFPPRWHFPEAQGGLRSSIADAVPLATGRALARAYRLLLRNGGGAV